jgi:tetrahydromethanopterin S-methyltransferase subunit B
MLTTDQIFELAKSDNATSDLIVLVDAMVERIKQLDARVKQLEARDPVKPTLRVVNDG